MLLQYMTRNPDKTSLVSDETIKDPKNPISVTILLVAMTPAVMSVLETDDPLLMILGCLPLAVMGLAAWLLLRGLAAEVVWKESVAANKPKVPCKILGCVALGVTAVLLGLVHSSAGVLTVLVQGVLTTGLGLLAFGLDPLKSKGLETPQDRARAAAQTKVDNVRARMAALTEQARALDDDGIRIATGYVAEAVERYTEAVLLDPMRLRGARQHLGPLFNGAEQSIMRFITVWKISADKERFLDFLDLTEGLSSEYHRAADGIADAGAQIQKIESDVLRHLIKRQRA